jgi:predicted sulfurtransferase
MNLIVLFTLAASLIAAGDGEETSNDLVACPSEKLNALRAKLKADQGFQISCEGKEHNDDQVLSCEKCKKSLAIKPKEELIAAGCEKCAKPPKQPTSES